MFKQTKLCCGLIALFSVFHHYSAAEAAIESVPEIEQKANEEVKAAPMAPVTFEGDDISFDNITGDVYAKGNVIIMQAESQLTADDIRGNTKSADVWVDGKAHITQPKLDLDGYDTFYNYQAKEGTMLKVTGEVDQKYIQGENLEFYPEEIIIYNGTITKCPAKKPDYHVSARKIEIWPDNKMVAYDAKFWVKDKVIYSTSRYETKIGENAKDDKGFPRIGYNSDDGVFIKQRLEKPITDEIAAFADIGYYSKNDFKTEYGVVQRSRNYELTLEGGDFQDDDDNWIKKEPELRLNFYQKRIGDTPYKYNFDASVGKWSDENKKSWHQDYQLYFSRDPIALSDSLRLYLGAGYQVIKESYDGSRINTLKQDITLSNAFSPKLTAWTGYHYTKNDNTRSLFNYDSADVAKELASGISYRIDKNNTLAVVQSYDLENSRTADMDYTWYRDLHCWQMALTYREKRDELKVKFDVTHW